MPIDAYDFCGGDMMAVFNTAIVTARKAHKCSDCRATIQMGEKYRRSSGLQEGYGWENYATCSPCDSLMQEVFDGGWVFGFLADVTDEEANERSEDADFAQQVAMFKERRRAAADAN